MPQESSSTLPTVYKTRRRLTDSASKPFSDNPMACNSGFALDFSDSGSGQGSERDQPASEPETESSGSSSPRHDRCSYPFSFEAVASSDTRVLIPSPPRLSTTTPRKQPRSSTTTPRKLHRAGKPTSQPAPSTPSLCDPICFGFFAPHKAPKPQPCFPKCLVVVLRHPSEPQCHPGQSQWRQKRICRLN